DNWRLDPGEIISYNINNISITNRDSFSPFFTNNFTLDNDPQTPELIYGSFIDGTVPDMALCDDNEGWVIESEDKFLTQRIEINFIFRNDTYIDFSQTSLEKVSIIINFSSSDNLDDLIFEIYNFEEEIFQDMSLYLDSIENDSWTFSIINNNNSLDWLFYPLEHENHTILFKIKGINSERFNISINDLDIEYSTRDININEDTGSRVVFGSITGNVQFERRSNSIPLSTFDMASIIATSYLNKYSVREGDLITYVLNLKNIGSNIAENISISLIIPGIIKNTSEYTLEKSTLTYTILKLAPYEEKTINFSFYVPNTRMISEISIIYYNPEYVQGGNSSKIVSITNEVYISAPLDYEFRLPFVRLIKIYSIMRDFHLNPSIFNLTYFLISFNPYGISTPDIKISIIDQIGDLKRVDSNDLYFENISYIVIFNITLNKVGWKGYYYPPINYIDSSEGKTIQILSSSSSILGLIDYRISKNVNKEQIKIGDEITVFIEVTNTGTINVGDILVNDIISYSQSEFSLIKGKLVNSIKSLEPGETVSLNYTIKAKKQGLVTLNPARINFYYLHKLEELSNEVSVKVITPQSHQLLYVLIPGIACLFILLIYFLQFSSYEMKKSKLKRTEKYIFKLSSIDSILSVESTLRDRLSNLSKLSKEKSEE
ncbi:MAG: BatD family protein, partial [Candidatus Thorarchaeota archaeon]